MTNDTDKFSIFPKGWRNQKGVAVLATKPQQVQSIGWVGEYIKSERARWATEELRRLIEKAETGGFDDEAKKELSDFKKLNFEVATFAGVFSYRNAKSLVERSPFMVLDIDDLPSLDEARRVQHLLINDRFVETVLCFVSPSGHGVKWVVRLPQCGRKRCFVRYVDTQRDCQYVDNRVGRCDHEHSCGYHYKPAEFFRDQPWARPDEQTLKVIVQQPSRPVIIEPLPEGYMAQSHSPHSTFWQWFCATCAQQLGISEETTQRLYDDYHIGATRRGEVIFWQVDEHQRIRTGHIMQYRTDGHRDGYQGWVHARMIRQGLLRQDFPLVQCFFGQHLLPTRPDATVCLVESEKTALIMAAVHPEHLWLSTCGSGGLSALKCQCLKGRRVVLFPDSGCLEKWSRNMQSCNDISYAISDQLEQYPANTDLADLLLHPP